MRYFYADPLAAAWMAKHFGMRFYHRHEYGADEAIVNGLNNFFSTTTSGRIEENDEATFYIHPDGLHLLEPQSGDICRYFDRAKTWYGLWDRVYNGDAEGEIIIQRDGKPFHWPESEAA